ncbi:hypothetical protein ACU8KH_02234 [Lachancea thermotolerans]
MFSRPHEELADMVPAHSSPQLSYTTFSRSSPSQQGPACFVTNLGSGCWR